MIKEQEPQQWKPTIYSGIYKLNIDNVNAFFLKDEKAFHSVRYSCRDSMIPRLNALPEEKRNTLGVEFGDEGSRNNAVNFILEWNKLLDFKPCDIYHVKDNQLMVVFDFDPEWVASPIRASFFTYLIKLGTYYDNTSIQDFTKNTLRYYANKPDVKVKLQKILTNKNLKHMDKWGWDTITTIAGQYLSASYGFVGSAFD